MPRHAPPCRAKLNLCNFSARIAASVNNTDRIKCVWAFLRLGASRRGKYKLASNVTLCNKIYSAAESTETVAVPTLDGNGDLLYGYSFFSSACDSDMALALARPVDVGTNEVVAGTAGLALYYLECRQPQPPSDDRFSSTSWPSTTCAGLSRTASLYDVLSTFIRNSYGAKSEVWYATPLRWLSRVELHVVLMRARRWRSWRTRWARGSCLTAELLLDGVRAHRLSERGAACPRSRRCSR